jgi:hypothetical protein
MSVEGADVSYYDISILDQLIKPSIMSEHLVIASELFQETSNSQDLFRLGPISRLALGCKGLAA